MLPFSPMNIVGRATHFGSIMPLCRGSHCNDGFFAFHLVIIPLAIDDDIVRERLLILGALNQQIAVRIVH